MGISTSNTSCAQPTCTGDALNSCPAALQVHDAAGRLIDCLSACTVYGTAQYCCSGAFGNSSSCDEAAWPAPGSTYVSNIHTACSLEYGYAYDDNVGDHACANAANPSYTITWCPNGQGASDGQGNGTPPATPTGLAATAGNSDVILNWSTASLATSYSVYRSTSSGYRRLDARCDRSRDAVIC